MDEETPEGAEQALRYYIAVVYWGYQTGDTETLEGLHQNSCETCLGFGDEISELGQAGSYWKKVTHSDFGIKQYDSEAYNIEIGYYFNLEDHNVYEHEETG